MPEARTEGRYGHKIDWRPPRDSDPWITAFALAASASMRTATVAGSGFAQTDGEEGEPRCQPRPPAPFARAQWPTVLRGENL